MKLITYTDGGSRSNPGPAASGIVIKDETGKILAAYGEYLGVNTNNVAEYSAIISALKRARELGATEVECLADSKLVIEQLSGNWKVKEPSLQKLWLEAWNLLQTFRSYKLTHILREKNHEADAEVNKILDRETGSKKKSFFEQETLPPEIPSHAKCMFRGIIFDVYQWEQTLYDGSTTVFERIIRRGSVDIIVPLEDKIMILTQEQIDKPTYHSFAGGRMERGEDPLEAAQRELAEETGYTSDTWELFSQEKGGGKVYYPNYIYIARDAKKTQAPHLDPGEKIEKIEFIPFETFLAVAKDRKFIGSLSLKFDIYEALLDPAKKEILRKKIFG